MRGKYRRWTDLKAQESFMIADWLTGSGNKSILDGLTCIDWLAKYLLLEISMIPMFSTSYTALINCYNNSTERRIMEGNQNLCLIFCCALSLSLLYMAYWMKKANTPFWFSISMSEKERDDKPTLQRSSLSFLAFFNAWTKFLAQYLPVLHAWEISFLFFLYVFPFTFYNYDYCIANNLQQRWWTFFSPFKITKNKVSWNLVLGLISENKKILCKLYKIYY